MDSSILGSEPSPKGRTSGLQSQRPDPGELCRESTAVRWQSIAEAVRQLQGPQVLPSKQLLQTGNPRMLLATLAWLFSCRPGKLHACLVVRMS